MKKIIIASLFLYVFLTAIFFFMQKNGFIHATQPQNHYSITITKDGFSPDELTIKKGDAVTFVNSDTSPHWPASNPHPTHDIYASFDPRNSILPRGKWTFQFDRVGEWHYHDHVIPFNTGVITVAP
jgi:plastocyanin